MFGHAKGCVGCYEFDNCNHGQVGLNKEQFLSRGSDGPNRNRTIWKHLNDHLKRLGFPGPLNFISYNVHAFYNDFKHSLSE